MRIAVVEATQEHVQQMLPNVRTADQHEVLAAYGMSVESMLGRCVANSDMAWAGLVDDEVACLFGVQGATLISQTGFPWLIGTDLIDLHAKAFLRRNRRMIDRMHERYPTLENYVDVRNVKSIAWLEWLGFVFEEPAPYGVYRMPFMKFYREV